MEGKKAKEKRDKKEEARVKNSGDSKVGGEPVSLDMVHIGPDTPQERNKNVNG